MGLAYLPCFMADEDPDLHRFPVQTVLRAAGLWLLAHADLRHTARIRAFLDFFYGAMSKEKEILEGYAKDNR